MKKAITWTILVAFVSTLVMQEYAMAGPRVGAPQSTGAKYSLAVLDLQGSGRVSSSDAAKLSDRLRSELGRTGIFQVMDKNQLQAALVSAGLNLAGCTAADCAMQAGRAAGTKLVANGTVSKVGPLYFIQVQIVHVKSGEVVQNVSEDFDGDFRALENHMPVIARKLVGQSSTAAATGTTTGTTTPTEYAAPEQETREDDFTEPAGDMEYGQNQGGGGSKALVIGLVAVGVVGGGLLISQALKKDDDGDQNTPPPGGTLPNPPTFP